MIRKTIIALTALLISTAALAWDTKTCLGTDGGYDPYRSGNHVGFTLQSAIEENGEAEVLLTLARSFDLLNQCPILKWDPEGWSKARLSAMFLADAALPVTSIESNTSTDCESVLNFMDCELILAHEIKNETNWTFTSIAVGCIGKLIRGGNINLIADVHYDVLRGGFTLAPHQSARFEVFFRVNRALHQRFSSGSLMAMGTDECHVLAAKYKLAE
jgi:hypothetical protein